MATDIERLVLVMEANIRRFEKEFDRASGVADRNMRQIERRVEQSEARVEGTMGRIGANIRAGVAGMLAGLSLGSASRLIDASTKITNSLKVTGLEGDKLEQTYQSLFKAAQDQGVPLEALVQLYGRAAMAQKELNVTSQELASFTGGVAMALRVAGTSTEEASGALLQLGQLLAGGKVQFEEYSSLIDGAFPVLQTVASGIEEAGGSVAKLTQLVKDGKVSSEAFFRGFEAGKPTLEALANKTAPTLAQQFQRLWNAVLDAVRQMDDVARSSEGAKIAFDGLIKMIQQAPDVFRETLRELAAVARVLDRIAGAGAQVNRTFREAAGTTAIISEPLAEGVEDAERPLTFRVRPRASVAGKPGSKQGEPKDDEAAKDVPVKRISLKSFPVPGDKDKKGGSEGGKSENDYEREIKAIGRRTRALDDERSVVGQSAYEVARSEAALRLEEAAKKANLETTEAMQIEIDQLASAYGRAKVALDEAEKKQREFQEVSRIAGATLADGFKDAILEGEKLTVVVDRLMKSIASRGIDSIFDGLFGKGGAGSGFLSSIIGGIGGAVTGGPSGIGLTSDGGWAEGGYTGPGGKHSPAGIVHRGEYVMDAATVRRIGRRNLDAIRRGRGYATGGYVSGGAPLAPMSPPAVAHRSAMAPRIDARRSYVVNAPGAQLGAAEQIVRALRAYDADLSRTLGQRFAAWKENN